MGAVLSVAAIVLMESYLLVWFTDIYASMIASKTNRSLGHEPPIFARPPTATNEYFSGVLPSNTSATAAAAAAAATAFHNDMPLSRLNLGEFLGRGLYTYTAVALFDPPLETTKQYVAKISGNWARPKDLRKKRPMECAARAVQIARRLSPHPSIPQILHHFHDIPNPFLNTSGVGLDFWPHAKEGEHKDRIKTSHRISLTLVERAVATNALIDNDFNLIVPAKNVRCFWRRLFQVLDYIHSKGIMVIDLMLHNIMLQDGKIIFFDLNMGRLATNATSVHARDTITIGEHVIDFLTFQQNQRKYNKTTISTKDEELLKDMEKRIRQSVPPPTMKWLLEHHEYFAIERSDPCVLMWQS
jgi:hypothetical protein